MKDILKTFFLTREDIIKALTRNDLAYCYDVLEDLVKENINIPETLISSFTLILIESGIDPLMYLNKVYPHMYKEIDYIDEVILPSNIESIGLGAFYGCSELTNLTIPNNVKGIGLFAFHNCNSLETVTIPKRFMNSLNNIFGHRQLEINFNFI